MPVIRSIPQTKCTKPGCTSGCRKSYDGQNLCSRHKPLVIGRAYRANYQAAACRTEAGKLRAKVWYAKRSNKILEVVEEEGKPKTYKYIPNYKPLNPTDISINPTIV